MRSFFKRISKNNDLKIALAISALAFFVYLFTWSGFFMGYENRTAQAALDLLQGKVDVYKVGIGAVLMYLPAVLIGKLFISGASLFKFLSLVPLLYSALISGLVYLCLQRSRSDRRINIIVAVLVAIASLLWPYSRIGMEYQTTILVMLLLLALLRWQDGVGSFYFVAAVNFLLVITKSYGIIFILPTVLYASLVIRDRKETILKNKKKWLLLALAAIAGMAINFGINYLSYGSSSGAYHLGTELKIFYWWEGFYGVFFSIGKSVFLYSPLLILSVFFWPRFVRQYRNLSYFILSSFILLLLVTAPFQFWSDETISVRKIIPVLPLLHFPLILFFSKSKKRMITILALLLIAISVYFQFINSIYSYWEKILVARSANIDTLSTVRWHPQFSHLYLHHFFFINYLQSLQNEPADSNYVFQERSWMRNWPDNSKSNFTLIQAKLDISKLRRPNTFLWNSSSRRNQVGFLVVDLVGILGSSYLVKRYYFSKKRVVTD